MHTILDIRKSSLNYPFPAFALWITLSTYSFAAPPSIEWIRPERGICIAIDKNDFVYTIDYDYNPGGDIYLNKFSPDGDSIWTVRYDQTDNTRWEQAVWVETDSRGNIIVAGTSKSGYSSPVNAASILMKFSPDGELIWRQIYEGSFDGSYTKKCLIDNADNIYVLGLGDGPTGKTTKIKKFNPDGAAVWIYNATTGIGAPLNFKFTPDNAIVIAGRGTIGSVNGYAKVDTSGVEIWKYPGIMSITAGDIAGDEDGNTYIINDNYQTNEGSILTKLSPKAEKIWVQDVPFAGFRVEAGNDQQPVVSGFPGTNQGGVAMMKWNRDGEAVWMNLNADSSRGLLLHAFMKMDKQNNIYLGAGTLFDMAICRVNEDGNSAWTLTTPGSYTNHFVINPQNSIFWVGGKTVRVNQNMSTGINAQTYNQGLSLFPQPTRAHVSFRLPDEGKFAISLLQMDGALVLNKFVQGVKDDLIRVDLPYNLPVGMYVMILSQSGKIYSSPLIVR